MCVCARRVLEPPGGIEHESKYLRQLDSTLGDAPRKGLKFRLTNSEGGGISAAMRSGTCGFLLTGLILLGFHAVRAGEPALKIVAIPKTDSGPRSTSREVAVGQLIGTYKVSVKNLSMMDDVPALTAKYRVFVLRDDGMKNLREVNAERVVGEMTVPAIAHGETGSFETASVKLKRTTLDPGYYYVNQKRSATTDKLDGIWIRLYQGDKMVSEYMSSSGLAKSGPF